MRYLLVKVKSAFGQIFCITNVAFESKNSSVPQYVILQGDFCFVSFTTFLTDEIPRITVLDHVSIHSLLA